MEKETAQRRNKLENLKKQSLKVNNKSFCLAEKLHLHIVVCNTKDTTTSLILKISNARITKYGKGVKELKKLHTSKRRAKAAAHPDSTAHCQDVCVTVRILLIQRGRGQH